MLKVVLLSMIAAAGLAVGHNSAQARAGGPKAIDDPEAYAVYASRIPEDWTVRVAHAKRLVILRETATYDRCIPSGGPMENEWHSPPLASILRRPGHWSTWRITVAASVEAARTIYCRRLTVDGSPQGSRA